MPESAIRARFVRDSFQILIAALIQQGFPASPRHDLTQGGVWAEADDGHWPRPSVETTRAIGYRDCGRATLQTNPSKHHLIVATAPGLLMAISFSRPTARDARGAGVTAVLGPTNTGKTYLA